MGREIERKFLVKQEGWRVNAERARYRQGYLSLDEARTVRVRTVSGAATGQEQGYLTIKGKTVGASIRELQIRGGKYTNYQIYIRYGYI